MVSSYKYFRFPFAISGDVTAIPDAVQPGGEVSYTQGFGPDYELDPGVNPAALEIPREESNQLYLDITKALKYIQDGGVPEWITNADNGGVAFVYAKNAIILYTDGIIYQSIAAANSAVPGTDLTKWRPIGAVGEQAGRGNWATESGSGNTFVIAPVPAIAAYENGQVWRFLPTHANTGAATLNVNGVGAKAIVLPNGDALRPGDISTGGSIECVYSATLDKFTLSSGAATPAYSTSGTAGYFRVPGTPFIIQWIQTAIPTGAGSGVSVPAGLNWYSLGNLAWPTTYPNACLFYQGAGDYPNDTYIQTIEGIQAAGGLNAAYYVKNTNAISMVGSNFRIFSLGW